MRVTMTGNQSLHFVAHVDVYAPLTSYLTTYILTLTDNIMTDTKPKWTCEWVLEDPAPNPIYAYRLVGPTGPIIEQYLQGRCWLFSKQLI
jgi:hypothetical protein